MEPKVLSNYLDAVSENIESKPEGERIGSIDFSQIYGKGYLNNDETREILGAFIERNFKKGFVPDLTVCGDDENGWPMNDWSHENGKLVIHYQGKNEESKHYILKKDREEELKSREEQESVFSESEEDEDIDENEEDENEDE